MRTIKFRAWDKEKKEMIFEGLEYYIRLLDVGSDWKKKSNPPIGFIKEYDYKRFIVQQFTGLTDKNGKEIYEGDIVKFRSHPNPAYIGEIKWSQEYARFMIVYFKDDFEREKNYPSTHSFGHENQLEIIGNIYENPELLKIQDSK